MLVDRFAASGPVVIGLDDIIERRWGPKIKARGIYRDPVRSSHGHFVKACGLRWLAAMLLVPVPWASRVWALPFLTLLMASERAAALRGVRHKTLVDGARQSILQIARWLPGRPIVVVADSAFSAIDLLAAVRTRVSVVTRLRLDARLFALFDSLWDRLRERHGRQNGTRAMVAVVLLCYWAGSSVTIDFARQWPARWRWALAT